MMRNTDLAPFRFDLPVAIGDSQVDCRGELQLPTLLLFVQEVAAQHHARCALSPASLRAQGKAWMLVQLALEVFTPARTGDELVFFTELAPPQGLVSPRHTQVVNRQGRVCYGLTTNWLLIDLQTRSILRDLPMLEKSSWSTSFPNACAAPDSLLRKLRLKGREPLIQSLHEAKWSELDVNQHVNHSVYARWILDLLYRFRMKNPSIAKLDIVYRREVRVGDCVNLSLISDPFATPAAEDKDSVFFCLGEGLVGEQFRAKIQLKES